MKEHYGVRGVLALALVTVCCGSWAQDEPAEEPADEPAEESFDEGGGSGSANGNDRRLYFAPMASYTMADDDRLTGDSIGGAISVGKKMTSGLNLELTGFAGSMGREDETLTSDSVELSGYGIAAMMFPSTTWTHAYLILALHQGQTNGHPTTPDQAGFDYKSTVFDTGVGYLFDLHEWIGLESMLRAEARYRMDSHHEGPAGVGSKDEFYEPVFNVGLLIPLGTLPGEPAPLAEQPAPPADADGDGVLDDADQCPDTPAGTKVDDTGCEVKEGCRAPGPGEAINLEGCATGEAVVLKGVNFETGSSRLTADAKVILNPVADSLAAAPHMRVEIGGHTDAQGSDAFNLKLSGRRAQAVKDYLVSRGIDASRMTSNGYGETQPVDSNETADGRELNRRVEMKVLEGGGE
ncbi:MAG: OmpA family protein [Nevskiaceae bacterium]